MNIQKCPICKKSLQKYGHKRGKQRYRCGLCKHQFCCKSNKTGSWIKRAYIDYIDGKQTLRQLSLVYKKSIRTIQKYFDRLPQQTMANHIAAEPINIIFDATFFSRSDGVLVFRSNKKNILSCFIASENLTVIANGLDELIKAGHQFKSFTIDGRRGVIQLLHVRYPGIPIQLCHFHQIQIIRRYTTNRPKTTCGKALKRLMSQLTVLDETSFSQEFFILAESFKEFLKERNENRQFVHRRLRSAFRSLKTNLPYLFTYKKHPLLGIPNTTNTCDGSFAHWKQKVKIHRGLKKHRRDKMVLFLLNKP